MPLKRRKQRVPKLCFTRTRNIGWHVNYRHPEHGRPTRHRFGMLPRETAEIQYHEWVTGMLKGERMTRLPVRTAKLAFKRKVLFGVQPEPAIEAGEATLIAEERKASGVRSKVVAGSLLHVGSGLLKHEQARTRAFADPRRQGTIHYSVFQLRRQAITAFLEFLNSRYGSGAVARMMLADLTMHDVEAFNLALVKGDYSDNMVVKHMQTVKAIIDRAGRPEHGGHVLSWNWDSRDVHHGGAAKPKLLPTEAHLRAILGRSQARERALIWIGIGLGFGQLDISALRVGQIDEKNYDLRRGKTGIERYGETPPMVWKAIATYLKETPRLDGELMFVTPRGLPLVRGAGGSRDAVQQWWTKQREALGAEGESLGGFYSLRHLGATEFGSRPGCSISEMKRWLGHGRSSQVADVYMRPVSPEIRKVLEFIRSALFHGVSPT